MSIYQKLDDLKSKIGKLSKDTSNPFYKSKYADINQLIELTDPLLRDNGLMCLQPIIDNQVVTQIIDLETSQMITSSITLPVSPDPQKNRLCHNLLQTIQPKIFTQHTRGR